jgi:hypothetical protein
MLRKSVVVAMFLTAFMGLSSAGAMASQPQGNGNAKQSDYCPGASGFTMMTASILPVDEAVRVDKNVNDWVCIKFLSTPDNASAGYVALDDHDRASN